MLAKLFEPWEARTVQVSSARDSGFWKARRFGGFSHFWSLFSPLVEQWAALPKKNHPETSLHEESGENKPLGASALKSCERMGA